MMTSIRKSIPMMVAGLLTLSAAMPVAAAPGDQPLPPRAPPSSQPDQPAGTALDYLFIAGSTFHPLESATTYGYSSSGCIYMTGGPSPLFAHKVVLPRGAIVRYLRLFYYDTSTNSVAAFFTTYDAAGDFTEHTSIASTNEADGYGSSLSSFDYEVDPFTAAVNVIVNLGDQNDSTLRFCGVRIAYDAPAADQIFKDGFDPQPL